MSAPLAVSREGRERLATRDIGNIRYPNIRGDRKLPNVIVRLFEGATPLPAYSGCRFENRDGGAYRRIRFFDDVEKYVRFSLSGQHRHHGGSIDEHQSSPLSAS